VIPAVVAVVLLIGGGVFVAVTVSQHHKPTATPIAAAPPPNTGPFTGTYRADYGSQTDLDGKPFEGEPATPATEAWGIRSVCRPGGCVATAARRRGQTTLVPTRVFDDVGGRWVAVAIGKAPCQNAPTEYWVVVTLQPRPDGTLSGESSTTTSGNRCAAAKQAVTFTRTGDVDINSLPDPASQPPRVVSPAEALHGRYHDTLTSTEGMKEDDVAVRTDCLRTGDRCMSYFHSPDSVAPLVFGSGKWTWNAENEAPCSTGGSAPTKVTAEYPLPEPPQNPITLLTGHGRLEATGPCAYSADFDDKYVRTGD
jgi:serine/threonine-protein kinase